MAFDWSTLALQTVNFAVLAWLLHRFLYKPVLRLIDERRAAVDKQFAEATASEDAAKAKLAEADADRARIAAERAEMVKAATAEAERAAEARRAEAERTARALVEDARKAVAEERGQALAEARQAAMTLGARLAARVLAELPGELRTEPWLARVEQHVAGLPAADREALLAPPGQAHEPVHVVTAVALPEPSRAEWRRRLGRALGDDVDVTFDADPALLAGAELHFPASVLRFSGRSALESLRTELEADGEAR